MSEDPKRLAARKLLLDLETELDQGYLEDTFEVSKVSWKMRLLADHERNWANRYIAQGSVHSIVSSVRAATLSIGIREINGMPLDLFFEDLAADAKALAEIRALAAETNPFSRQYWLAERLYAWLSQRTPQFVDSLWAKWLELEGRRDRAEESMGKSLSPDGT